MRLLQLATQSQPPRLSQPAIQSESATLTPTRQLRRRGSSLRANNLDVLSQAIRGIVRDEIMRIQPVIPQPVIQQPVIPRANMQSRTIHRSAASQIEMQRLPSGFECFGPPQSSQQGPHPGPREYPHSFPPAGSRPPAGDLLPSIETNSPGAFSRNPILEADTIVVEGYEQSQPKRQRRQHRVKRGGLLPYKQQIVFE
ncbi:hypothetical protein EDB80DRAFT_898586 [Ilyonectria destructans]|nr:hypothetical protein EDB80DRAFT_898586 [Ilyonectria destructans]